MDIDDCFEYFDGAVFGLLIPIGASIALAIRHGTGRWFQRVCAQVGDIPSTCALNGREAAVRLLTACGLGDVAVKQEGLIDCYHPWKREIRLRPNTYDNASLSALAAAAHEVGHAQHFSEKIWRCRLRNIFWPVCWALPALAAIYAILCFLGMVHFSEYYLTTGILIVCALVVVLQLPISLPLERDASQRAMKIARENGLLADHEQVGFDRVLGAAWKTHASAEVQRWIVFSSIALAAAGYLWYWSFQNQLLERFQAYQALPHEEMFMPEVTSQPVATSDSLSTDQVYPEGYVYVPEGWENIVWLIPIAPYLFVIGFILMTFLGNSQQTTTHRKLTREDKAVLRNNAAGAMHAEGQYDAAIAEYSAAIKLNPQFTVAWYNRGQADLSVGRLEEALNDFETAVRLAPHFLDAVAARGQARLLLGNEDLGLADLGTVLATDPTNTNALVMRSDFWYRRGEFERAIADWTEAIERNAARAEFYRSRGLLYYLRGDYELAVSDQTEAIRLDPSDAVARNNRGTARLKRGDWAAAADDLRAAIQLDPKLPNSYRHLAWLQATCPEAAYRDGDQAVAHATRALELTDWKQHEWLETLAAAHAEAGSFDEAVRWQQECLDQRPNDMNSELQARLELYEGGQPFRTALDGEGLPTPRSAIAMS